jgi:hypothetical protein
LRSPDLAAAQQRKACMSGANIAKKICTHGMKPAL